MDEFDCKVSEVLSMLAAVVNRASGSRKTSAEAVKVSDVPTALLREARQALAWWSDTEYTTEAIRQAVRRTFD